MKPPPNFAETEINGTNEMKNQRSSSSTCLLFLAALGLQLLAIPTASADSFTKAGSMSALRLRHGATLLSDGKVLAAGGYNFVESARAAELYDPAMGTWTATGSMNVARADHIMTLLPNGKVLVAGGINGTATSGNATSSAELYDPTTGTWTLTGAMSTNRSLHTATFLPNGKVLVAGGENDKNGLPFAHFSSAELYDPAAGTWAATGSMSTARCKHTATLLPNGKVLVAGGYSGSAYLSNAELYDPVTGTWTVTGSMSTARAYYTATLLPNGKVLAAGGYNPGETSSAELYDPATGTWAAAGSMGTSRSQHTATLLPNGKVVVAGGWNNTSHYLSSAELYDATAGTWAATSAMKTIHVLHTATLLPSGKVLVAGGVDGSAELYEIAPSIRLLAGGDVQLSYLGIAGTNYALERTFDLLPVVDWVPQATNLAGAGSMLLFTNTPVTSTNNFWRIRSVP